MGIDGGPSPAEMGLPAASVITKTGGAVVGEPTAELVKPTPVAASAASEAGVRDAIAVPIAPPRLDQVDQPVGALPVEPEPAAIVESNGDESAAASPDTQAAPENTPQQQYEILMASLSQEGEVSLMDGAVRLTDDERKAALETLQGLDESKRQELIKTLNNGKELVALAHQVNEIQRQQVADSLATLIGIDQKTAQDRMGALIKANEDDLKEIIALGAPGRLLALFDVVIASILQAAAMQSK